ncbi:hypothetical protein SpCBS45565_g02641 [Spizellomyces sp. 'palustris']|nr:hypothetical protein SpCBS45565_g02641 [Spizellomyces sp. 'palustris']
MGKSAKFGRAGKTKKERDQIKIAKNSRITKSSTTSSTAANISATINQEVIQQSTNKTSPKLPQTTAKPKHSTKDPDGDVVMSGSETDRKIQPKGKRYILEGRVDYVSLMNSRRSAKALLHTKDRIVQQR